MEQDSRQEHLIKELRRQGVKDERVLAAIANTPREMFVDAPFADSAYHNSALPIACGQTISQPFVVAYMTEHLEVGENMRVLEIGTGSGYQAAVLSPLCRRVYTIERHRPLLDKARERFTQLKLENVVTKHGDGFAGWPEQAPFDRILLSCAVQQVPQALVDQLKLGGILIAPVGTVPKSDGFGILESISQRLTKMIRNETGVTEEVLIPVVFVPMVAGLPGGGA
ncbi:MAG TPA: protein-L-isoaspartate(D-aspartate) O-methyltransferase [Rhizomicrobium sp.]|nr:protein-L-isoaspartate(D-aspartate) O-methyltransferase [Rhizomicrobium sp.]